MIVSSIIYSLSSTNIYIYIYTYIYIYIIYGMYVHCMYIYVTPYSVSLFWDGYRILTPPLSIE